MSKDNDPCGDYLCCRGIPVRVATAVGLVVKEQKMAGYKTYAAAALMAAYAVVGCLMGWHGVDTMTQLLLNAAALAGIRHSNTTETKKLLNRFQ